MTTIATPPVGSVVRFIADHPWRTVVRLLPAGIAVMFGVDAVLGDSAEYFNAWNLLGAWRQVLTGGAVDGGAAFIMHQDAMSGTAALGIGTTVLFLEPAIALAGVVWPAARLLRRRG